MLFLGIEILSIPLYILAGGKKHSYRSSEASFKYFLLGSFATAFFLFGIAFIYGVTGSFDLPEIQAYVTAMPEAGPALHPRAASSSWWASASRSRRFPSTSGARTCTKVRPRSSRPS